MIQTLKVPQNGNLLSEISEEDDVVSMISERLTAVAAAAHNGGTNQKPRASQN